MSNDVVIKSNRYGVNLILNDQVSFPELLKSVGEKFKETEKFFGNSKMAVSFQGRALSPGEEQQLLNVIAQNCSLQIVCVMERGTALEEQMRQGVETVQQQEYAEIPETAGSDFYRGNLRSGQVLESASNVTLVGDVNPGATIIAQGNVVILGSLRGNACAGAGGDAGCFIFALDMRPIQLQIGEYIAKSPDREREKRRFLRKEKNTDMGYTSQIALVREGNICIEPMTKGCLDRL